MRPSEPISVFFHGLLIAGLTLSSLLPVALARPAAARNSLLFSIPVGEHGVLYHGVGIDEMEITGPQAIAVTADGTFVIVDTVGGRLLRYTPSGEQIDAIHLEGAVGVTDAVAAGDDVVVLDEAALEPAVLRVSSAGAVLERSALPREAAANGLSGITVDDAGAVLAELQGGQAFLSLDGAAVEAKRSGESFAVRSPSPADPAADLRRGDLLRNGQPFAAVEVEEMLGSMKVLAVLPTGEVFVLVEEVAFTPAVVVDQRVYRFGSDGSLTGVARVPLGDCFAYVKQGVAVGPDGRAYALVTREERVDVVRLGFKARLKRVLPESVQVEEKPAGADKPGASVAACSITRDAIKANSNAYVNNRQWYSTAALDGGCEGRGKPRYLGSVAGYYTSVSYDHGGWDTLTAFNTGIAGSSRAGDIDKTAVETCSVGTDCSGFVTRALGLTTRYSTRTFDDISFVIPKTSVGTGDLMIKDGVHSAIVDYTGPNGLYIWECTTYRNYDRVTYHWDSWSRFNSYTPRRLNTLCL